MSSMQVAMLAGDEILKIEIPELRDPPVAKLCQHSRHVETHAPTYLPCSSVFPGDINSEA